MSKVWECIVDVFIGILIMFVSVSVYFGLRTESVIKSMYEDITDEFVTNVKKNGVLTLDDYEGYMERMGTGNNLFNISFEHRYKIYEPEYRFKTLEEILADQNNAYTGSNDYHYREVITERPPVDDSINSGNLNTETNESILARAVNGPKDPNHVHDESCYGGHKHVGEQSFTHMHTHEPGKCIEFVSATTVRCHCNSCDAIYYVGSYYYWNDNTNRVELGSSDFTGTAICITCRGTSITVDAPLYYYGYSCGYRPFYIYGLPEGAGVREPYWVELEYKLINPQGRPGGTYISGCYTYHQTKTVFHNFSKDDLRNIIPLSVYYGVNKMIYTERFRNYCEIPLYYTVGLSDSTYFYYGEVETHPSKGPCLCYLRYKAYLDENGNLRFKLMNYFATASSDTPMRYGTDNPGFPDNITANQLAAFNESYINNLFYEVFDVNYRSYREYHYGDSVVAHIKCFDTDNPSELYEHLDICPYDHSQGTDRWFKTCGYDEDGTLDCDRIIVSLEPTHKVQTVYVNDPLITTATATYLDGSTATVLCSTEHETSAIVRDKEVTIVYVNTIDDIDYRHTAEITVTVIPRNKVCPKGHIYNLNADGSDPGCPYCKEWVESLRIINPTTSPIVITIGTTLIDNNVWLLGTYMDGHTEEVTNGYIDNLDIHYLGTKPVTIGYKGASVTVLVTTVCATMVCDICGYEYSLYPDGTNPGCPRCLQKIPVFTGNIMIYERKNHTEEVLDMLYRKKKYIFNIDDEFSVEVSNKSSTIARKVLSKLYPSISDKWINIEKRERVMSK